MHRLKHNKYNVCLGWTTAHWMQALVGEIGELANLLKKCDRGDMMPQSTQKDIAKELADIQAYLDILSYKLNVDLGEATLLKFNEVSDRIGSLVKLVDCDTPYPVDGKDLL